MLRVLAVLFVLLALIALAGDLYASLSADGVIRLRALGEWWASIHRDSLLLLQPAVERHITPEIWDPGIQTLLEMARGGGVCRSGGSFLATVPLETLAAAAGQDAI